MGFNSGLKVLRVVIIHVQKCSGQERNVPTPKTDKYTWT